MFFKITDTLVDITKNDSHKSFRPVTVLTFKLNRLLFETEEEKASQYTPGRIAPVFHEVNVFLHLGVCVAVHNQDI